MVLRNFYLLRNTCKEGFFWGGTGGGLKVLFIPLMRR